MKIQEMTREQLIVQIDVLEGQVRDLKEAEERFQFYFYSAPVSLSITSAQGDILNANKVMQDLLGYTLEELKTMNILEVYFEPAKRQQLLNMLYESNHIHDFETTLKHKDGTIWTVLMNSDYIDMDSQKVLLTSIYDITRFKQVQEDLREFEERYRILFDIAPVGIIVTDFQGGMSAGNKAIQELLGYSVEELKTVNSIDFYLDPTERQRLLDLLEKSGVVRDFETKFKRKDGQVFTVLMNSDLIDFSGKNKMLLTSVRDISILKQTEAQLTKERDYTNAILDTTASLMLVMDREGKITRFNRACEKITGYSFREMKGQHIWDTLSNNPAISRETVDNLLAGNYPNTHESLWNTRSGEQRLISWSSTVLLDNENKVAYIIATGIDITERKEAEGKLLKSEEEYRTIFENTGTAMMVVEEDMTVSMVNSETEKLFGYSREEVEGKKKWTVFVAQDDLARMAKYHQQRRINPADVPTYYEYKFINEQGAVKNISVIVSIIPGTKKSVASLLDITERKESERKLQETNEKLSSSVKALEERTVEMSQLSEMVEQLQSCQNIEEACTISAQYIQELFPADQGALYLINSAKDLAEAANMWGDATSMEKIFMASNCWAIRRGRPHLVDNSHPGLLCEHTTGSLVGKYLCVPMIAHGETLGILHLNRPTPEQDQQASTARLKNSEHQTQLALAMAEDIALAISSLKLRETLRQQSIRDILTGLFNRRYMEESLTRELRRAEREKKTVGVIMFDIDHFKDFNDLFGHDGGDALLRELGAFLNAHTRGGDIVSRYGGEEFVSVLPGATLENTRLRAEELRQGVKELQVYSLGKPLNKCTLSFGVAAFPEHGLTGDEILKSADIALYRAKSEGRDRVIVASTN